MYELMFIEKVNLIQAFFIDFFKNFSNSYFIAHLTMAASSPGNSLEEIRGNSFKLKRRF